MSAQLYKELDGFLRANDFHNALKRCDAILAESPDEEAQHCKAACLLRLSRFDDAVALLETLAASAKLGRDLAFEHAYALYRLKRFDEAVAVLQQRGSSAPRERKLLAQTFYRLGKFDEAATLYRELLATATTDADEILVNLVAAAVRGRVDVADLLAQRSVANPTYELMYNLACIDIAHQRFAAAEANLARARELCVQSLQSDGATQQEIAQETAAIDTQLAYVYLMTEREADAASLCSAVTNLRLGDDSNVAEIASNNLAVASAFKRTEELVVDRAAVSRILESRSSAPIPRTPTSPAIAVPAPAPASTAPAAAPGPLPSDEPAPLPDIAPRRKTRRRGPRKPRLPKNFDPSNPGPLPAADRWLPMRDRAGYHKRGARRQNANRGAQGSTKAEVLEQMSIDNIAAVAPAASDASRRPAGKQRGRGKGRRH